MSAYLPICSSVSIYQLVSLSTSHLSIYQPVSLSTSHLSIYQPVFLSICHFSIYLPVSLPMPQAVPNKRQPGDTPRTTSNNLCLTSQRSLSLSLSLSVCVCVCVYLSSCLHTPGWLFINLSLYLFDTCLSNLSSLRTANNDSVWITHPQLIFLDLVSVII